MIRKVIERGVSEEKIALALTAHAVATLAGVPMDGADWHACSISRSFSPKRVPPQQTPAITQDFD